MTNKTHYTNGQIVRTLEGDRLTYFYKSGKIKAQGRFVNDKMQGEWRFYAEDGRLMQIGHLKDDIKEGAWTRFNEQGEVEYDELFANGKIQKKKP